jgi:hypothetical protein
MSGSRHSLLSASLWLLLFAATLSSAGAWAPLSQQPHRLARQDTTSTTGSPPRALSLVEDVENVNRRSFLGQATFLLTSAASSATVGPASAAWAAEDATNESSSSPPGTASLSIAQESPSEAATTPVADYLAVSEASEDSSTSSLAATLEQEERELVATLKADSSDQVTTEKEDTEALIEQLEQEEIATTALSSSSNEKAVASVQEKTELLVERLEKDEEKTEAEILQLIDKTEKILSDEERLEASSAAAEPVSPVETKEFVAVLKERSVENKDLVETLKTRSQRYYNAKTGRFDSMSQSDFLKRKEEVLKKENVAGQLFDRIKEGIKAAEEGLAQDEKVVSTRIDENFPGMKDNVKKLALRAKEEFLTDKAAVERLIEDEGLLEVLRAREKDTEAFVAKYGSFLDRLDASSQ